MKMKSLRRLGLAPVLAAVIAIGASGSAAAGPSANSAAVTPNCVVASNIQAIIDDSGSTSVTDQFNFRARTIEILTAYASNQNKTLGATEFGSTADPLFAPLVIGPNRPLMISSLGLLFSDNGGTDFQLAFNAGKTANPGATARIFISDGQAPLPTAHKTPPTKTYVIGFADATTSAAATLNQIATDTGGAAFLVSTAPELQAVIGTINARLNCKTDPQTFTSNFTKSGQTKTVVFKATGPTAEVVTTWSTAGTTLVPTPQVRVLTPGVASTAKKKKKLKFKRVKGTSFQTLQIRGLKKKQKVKIKIKGKTVVGPTTAVTQVTQ